MRTFLLASGVLLGLAGCAGDSATPEAAPTGASGETVESWDARGVYLGSKFEGEAATLDHEAIPGLMDAMKMDFLLDSPEATQGLEPGDKVSFRLDYIDNRVIASGFEALPDTTALVLASGPLPTDSLSD